MRKSVMYIVGLAPLGLGYPWLKAALTGPMLLGLAIVYALLLRLICEKLGRLDPVDETIYAAKHVILPKDARNAALGEQGKKVKVSLGGCFYDYLRRADGEIAGVTYWMMGPMNFERHPVYAQFLGDDRFDFDASGGCVRIVFDESDAGLLQKGQLTADVVQEFG